MAVAPGLAHPTPATRAVAHPWLTTVGFALIPVVLTAAGSAAGQILGAGDAVSSLLIAAGAAVSAAIGLIVMRGSSQPLGHYGFRAPRNARAVWWFAPPALTVVLVIATSGVNSTLTVAGAYLVLAIAAAVNEETWFRGIIVALLRPVGMRSALLVSSALFGVLHLANLAGGASPASTLLQVAFALLFGFVAAEVVIVTGSLWPTIVWHLAWNFTSLLGGNSATTPLALTGIGLACVVMALYAARLWRPAVDKKV